MTRRGACGLLVAASLLASSASAQDAWLFDNVSLVSLTLHNAQDDDVEVGFDTRVCVNAANPSVAIIRRATSTNYDFLISTLTAAMQSGFRLKIITESGTCQLLSVWFMRK